MAGRHLVIGRGVRLISKWINRRGERLGAWRLVDSSASRVGDRDRGHQRFRVGVTRVLEHRWPRTEFNETSQIHDPNEVRYPLDDRLVGYDQARMGRDCAGDRDALPLSSGQFVRVAVKETAREIDAVE